MGCWCQSWAHNEATLSLTSDPRRHFSHLDINLDDTLILFTNSYRLEPNAKARAVVSVVRLIPGSGITNCRVVRWDTFFSCHPSLIVLVRPPPMLVWMDVNSLISITEPTPLFKRALIPEDFRNLSLQMIYFSFFPFQERTASKAVEANHGVPNEPPGPDWGNQRLVKCRHEPPIANVRVHFPKTRSGNQAEKPPTSEETDYSFSPTGREGLPRSRCRKVTIGNPAEGSQQGLVVWLRCCHIGGGK